ncbi:MAG: hypothetical protein IKE43_09620 [Coriobacteriales bacterium]|nr:hypothetical protein [Coriobacteriales bacterium]
MIAQVRGFARVSRHGYDRLQHMLCLAACIVMAALCIGAGPAFAASSKTDTQRAQAPSNIILYTVYEQMGWGDRVQVGALDEDGVIWGQMYDSGYKQGWEYALDKQLEYMTTPGNLERLGKLDSESLFVLKGLVSGVEDQGTKPAGGANDAGVEKSWAVTYSKDGTATRILLGASGDSVFENFDPDAQALYLYMRVIFPFVTRYAGGIGPAGYIPQNLSTFLGYSTLGLEDATVIAYEIDCEAGPREIEITGSDIAGIKKLATQGKVYGKSNAMSLTGGTTVYSFYDKDGNHLASIELYRGLLVTNDGMYFLSEYTPPTSLMQEIYSTMLSIKNSK